LMATEAEQNEPRSIVANLFNGKNPRVRLVEKDADAGAALKTILQPDAAFAPSGKDFGFVHRKTADADIYFVANTSNVRKNVEISFRNTGNNPEIWNAMDGSLAAANVRSQTAHATNIVLNFEPYGSQVVVFSKRRANLPKAQTSIAAVSTVDLNTGWRVGFGKNAPVLIDQLKSWTEDETTKFFSGVATYEKSFNLTADQLRGAVRLDFGEPSPLAYEEQRNGMRTYLDAPVKEAAVVHVNGQRAGSVWSPPYSLDVTRFLKTGENTLKIEVANTAINHMAGRNLPNYRLLNLRYTERFQPQEMEKVMAYPSGLTGNIRLISVR